MRIVTKEKEFRCSRSERGCALPKLPPGEYPGLFEASTAPCYGRGAGYDRFILPDGRIIPLLGPFPQHLKGYACPMIRPHGRHYHGDCPSGPTYCSGGDWWADPVEAVLVVRHLEEHLYRVTFRCKPEGYNWFPDNLKCRWCGEPGTEAYPWSFGGYQALHPTEGRYQELLLLDEEEIEALKARPSVVGVQLAE